MNRSAIGYLVTLLGFDGLPFIGKAVIEETPTGTRALVDDGSCGPKWFPPLTGSSVPIAEESDNHLTLRYPRGTLSENGIELEPITVERWNTLARLRPEMTPVKDFDDLCTRLTW